MTENTEMGGRGAKSKTNTGVENKAASAEAKLSARPKSFTVGRKVYSEDSHYKVNLDNGSVHLTTPPFVTAKTFPKKARIEIERKLNELVGTKLPSYHRYLP